MHKLSWKSTSSLFVHECKYFNQKILIIMIKINVILIAGAIYKFSASFCFLVTCKTLLAISKFRGLPQFEILYPQNNFPPLVFRSRTILLWRI